MNGRIFFLPAYGNEQCENSWTKSGGSRIGEPRDQNEARAQRANRSLWCLVSFTRCYAALCGAVSSPSISV